MHRVGSTAMQSLAAYSDSDDDEFVGGGSQKRRSSEGFAEARNRRTSTSDTLPEAPVSRESSPQHRPTSSSSNNSRVEVEQPWISPEPGESPKKHDHHSGDTGKLFRA